MFCCKQIILKLATRIWIPELLIYEAALRSYNVMTIKGKYRRRISQINRPKLKFETEIKQKKLPIEIEKQPLVVENKSSNLSTGKNLDAPPCSMTDCCYEV